MRVLIVEDGHEYTETWGRFVQGVTLTRAGNGPEALGLLEAEQFDVVVLDMRFDRVADEVLLGDWDQVLDRCNGDPVRARAFLQDHQGNYILAALRDAGVALPVVFSHDFSEEPRRWTHVEARFAPVSFLSDAAGPAAIRAHLDGITGGGGAR